MTTYHFILNPVAGGIREKAIDEIVAAVRSAGNVVEVYRTTAPNDATRYVRENCASGVVVAVGGDGTTNEVINGLPPNFDGVLAVVPQGTTNVLAEELRLPRKVKDIVAMLLGDCRKSIFPLRANGRRFLLMAGVGYDARVVANVDLNLKRRIGKGAYVLSMVQQIQPYGSYTFEYRVNDGLWLPAASMIITKGRYYGGSFVLSRSLSVTDDFFQVFAFRDAGRLSLLRYLAMLPLGLMEQARGIEVTNAHKVEVRCVHRDVFQADGDVMGQMPLTVEIEDNPLSVIVP